MTRVDAGFVEAAARAAQAGGAHVRGSPSICLVPQHNVCQSPGCSGPLTQVCVLIQIPRAHPRLARQRIHILYTMLGESNSTWLSSPLMAWPQASSFTRYHAVT